MKIIYIAGDGRSGSTLLDAILSNTKDTISVGECYRFFKRYYEADTLCGCTNKIEECELWSKINSILNKQITNYNPTEIWYKIQTLLQFKNINKIKTILKKPNWKYFCDTVILFYKSIAKITNKNIIIDSSKNSGWLYILKHLNFCELKIIHLERNLQAVANSWKKKVYLPEYHNKKVLMPIKNNFTILKSWVKIKYLLRKLKKMKNYYYLNYENFVTEPSKNIKNIYLFIEEQKPKKIVFLFNHSIGGNPMRSNKSNEITINKRKKKLTHLNIFEYIFFLTINKLTNFAL